MKKNIFYLLLGILFASNLYSQNIINSYDVLGRVTKVIYPDNSIINYTYDNMGNRFTSVIQSRCNFKPKPIITALDVTTFCNGDSVILQSSHGIKYHWSTGDTTQSIKVFTGGNYTVTRLDTFQCNLTSSSLAITVNPILTSSVSISSSSGSTICSGTDVTFTATPTNGGANPIYHWKLNGGDVGTNSSTYSNNSLSTGDQILCVMSSNASCITGNPATSNILTFTVNASLATNRYWVGGTDVWDGTAGLKWSTCSGGPGGGQVFLLRRIMYFLMQIAEMEPYHLVHLSPILKI